MAADSRVPVEAMDRSLASDSIAREERSEGAVAPKRRCRDEQRNDAPAKHRGSDIDRAPDASDFRGGIKRRADLVVNMLRPQIAQRDQSGAKHGFHRLRCEGARQAGHPYRIESSTRLARGHFEEEPRAQPTSHQELELIGCAREVVGEVGDAEHGRRGLEN
jgi:hypothetical protein